MVTTSGVTLPLVEVVTLAQRHLARGLSAILAEEGATLDQFRVLRALAAGGDDAGGDGLAMGELAETLQVPHPSVTRLVDGLVDTGLVYRRQSDADRRKVAVHLSRLGAQRLERLSALVEAHEEAVRASAEWADIREQLLGLRGSRG